MNQNYNNEEDNKLINEIKKGINASSNFNFLLQKHSPLFFKISRFYLNSQKKNVIYDFNKDKNFYFYKFILDYDQTKGTKFSTYVGNRVKWLCLNIVNSIKKKSTSESSDCPEDLDFVTEGLIPNSNISSQDITDVIQVLKNDPDRRVYEIFKYRYLQGKENNVMPWKEVCKKSELNLSIQGCINIHNKFIKKIKNKQKAKQY